MIVFQTKQIKVKLDVIFKDNQCFLQIILFNNIIAELHIEDVWDFIKDKIITMPKSTSPGLCRRQYEAKNIYRLTEEYLKKDN